MVAADEVHDVVLVGGGFHGVYLLHRLRAEGFDVHLLEAAPALGGVWYWNCYPGARVDSHIPNYEFSLPQVWRDWTWRERFPGRDELLAYFAHVDDALDISADTSFDTTVTGATFDEDARCWEIRAASTGNAQPERTLQARWLLLCTGFAAKPYVPDLPGLDTFAGEWHHTARWPQQGLSLAGQQVGVIGTGASGVQVIQEAARDAERVVVYQRTPVMALPMRQRTITPDEHAAQKAHYPEIFRIRNAPPTSFYDLERPQMSTAAATPAERQRRYQETWDMGGFNFWFGTFDDVLFDEDANRQLYAFWRDRVRERVGDPRTAALLAPDVAPHPFGTKRPSLEQDFYDVWDQDNVELVDLHTQPLQAGDLDDFDVVALATGFDANTGGITQIDLRGPDGAAIADRWAAGVDTHLGLATAGFPNLLFLYGPQSPASFCNGPTCAEVQGEWVVQLLEHLRAEGRTRLEATDAAQQEWSSELEMMADATLFGRTDSWYMGANIPGKRRQLLNWLSSDSYFARLDACAAEGYAGFELA